MNIELKVICNYKGVIQKGKQKLRQFNEYESLSTCCRAMREAPYIDGSTRTPKIYIKTITKNTDEHRTKSNLKTLASIVCQHVAKQ